MPPGAAPPVAPGVPGAIPPTAPAHVPPATVAPVPGAAPAPAPTYADVAGDAGVNPMLQADGQQSLALGTSLCSGRYLVQVLNVRAGRNNQKVPFLGVDVRVLKCLDAQTQVDNTGADAHGNPMVVGVPQAALPAGTESAVIMKLDNYAYGQKERNTFMCQSIRVPDGAGGWRHLQVHEITAAMCQYVFTQDSSCAIGQYCIVDKRWKQSKNSRNNVNTTTWMQNVPAEQLSNHLTPEEMHHLGLTA